VDLATFAIVRTIQLPAPPRGLALSADGGTLYAALDNIGSVGIVNLANGQIEVVDVTNELGNLRPNDVIEAAPGSVLVSADGPGLAYVALVRRDLANSTSRVASGRRVEGSPRFAASDDRSSVYINSNSHYRLDASQASMPVVAEWPFGTAMYLREFGIPHPQPRDLEISSNGSRLYTLGAELDPQTLEKRRGIPSGWIALSADGARLYAADWHPDAARVYDAETLTRIGEQNWGCTFPPTDKGPGVVESTFDRPDGIEVTAYGLIAFRLKTMCGTRTVPYP
jgi:DNA-binding beta-propeller fold protein YncE